MLNKIALIKLIRKMNPGMGLVDAKGIVEYLLEKTNVEFPISLENSVVSFISLMLDISKELASGKYIWDGSKLVYNNPNEVTISSDGFYGYKLS
jgi:hypothetical protein